MTPAARWTDAWFRAWTEHDPTALAVVYAGGAVQRSAPFRERDEPQRYAAWAFSDEEAVEVWFAEPSVEGEGAAACEWWAVSRDRSGRVATLAGVSLLRLSDDGRVVDQRDYWSREEGSRRPPDGWGPVSRHGRLGASAT
jgi:SnoaL-like domain